MELTQQLDAAEDLIEHRRSDDAEALLESVADRLQQTEADDLLRVRVASISLARRNHQGLPPAPSDPAVEQSCHALLRRADAAGIHEVVHLYNRQVVSRLNVFDLESADERVRALIEWRGASESFTPEDLDSLPVMDWDLGALYGTLGQVEAISAHAEGDLERLDAAIRWFGEARRRFRERDDLMRQDVYLAHAWVERVRLGGTLPAAGRAHLERVIAAAGDDVAALNSAQGSEVAWGKRFRIAVALKAGAITGMPIPWLNPLIEHLRVFCAETPVPHPYTNIIGWTLVLRSSAPKEVRRALERMAETARSSLGRWVALVMREMSKDAPDREMIRRRLPVQLRGWWEAADLDARLSEGRVDRVLPFNYA